MAAVVNGAAYAAAWGRNKKEAEQRAACNALAQLAGQPVLFSDDIDSLISESQD